MPPEFVATLLEVWAPELRGPAPGAAFDRLEAADGELAEALDWCLEHDAELGCAVAGAVWPFWLDRARIAEGREWSRQLLEATIGERTLARARALYGAGTLAFAQGDGDTALPLHRESLAIAEELGDMRAHADALIGLARVALLAGDIAEMRRRSEESLAVARAAGDEQAVAVAFHHVVEAMRRQGELEAAEPLYRESIEAHRRIGSERGVALELHNLGNVERKLGDLEASGELLVESLSIAARVGASRMTAYCLLGLGNLAAARGDADRVARLIAAADALFEQAGVALDPDYRDEREASVYWARSRLGERYAAVVDDAREQPLEKTVAYALAL